MPLKFSALDITYLMTDARNVGRLARKAEYAKQGGKFTHVVCCETSDGSWCEFDAGSIEHGRILADNAVDKLRARGCSVWPIAEDGSLHGPIAYRVED